MFRVSFGAPHDRQGGGGSKTKNALREPHPSDRERATS
jgi:hypothetical protein